jgi:phage repressor protein C with HTH and peptisase S24 domain
MIEAKPAALEYLRYVLAETGLSPGALAKKVGVAGSTFTRPLNANDYKFAISTTTLNKIEAATGMSYSEFVAKGAKHPTPNVSFPPRYEVLASEHGTPLMGQSVTGPNGRFLLNGQKIMELFTPPDLVGVKDAYAVQVYGTSMEPAFFAGQKVWLNPTAPVRAGDFVVVQIYTDEEDLFESYLKQFVSRSSTILRLRQFNPEEGESEELTFDAKKVFSVHKIVFAAFV